jgi:hypothetical protein
MPLQNSKEKQIDPNVLWVGLLGTIMAIKAGRTICNDPDYHNYLVRCNSWAGLASMGPHTLWEFLLLTIGIACICFSVIHFKNRTKMSFWQIITCVIGSIFWVL